MTLIHDNYCDNTYLQIDNPAAGILQGSDLQELKMVVVTIMMKDADGDNKVSVYSLHSAIHTHCFRTQGVRMLIYIPNHVPKTPTLSEPSLG
jgi:hypothetical protein